MEGRRRLRLASCRRRWLLVEKAFWHTVHLTELLSRVVRVLDGLLCGIGGFVDGMIE